MKFIKTVLRLAITAGIAWIAYDFGYRDGTREVVRAVRINDPFDIGTIDADEVA